MPQPNMSATDVRFAAIPPRILNIPATLGSGQSFRWRPQADGSWMGVIDEVVVRLNPSEFGFHWQTWPQAGCWEPIAGYFALDVDLESLQAEWRDRVPEAADSIAACQGLRILRQDAGEALFSFMCASCNTVVKITRTIQALERRAGELIAEVDGQAYHRFPTAERIAAIAELDLRCDLWGFRAPRLLELAMHAASQPEGWMESLRALPYREAHGLLTRFFGIGDKIADCVCLFGLWHDEAVPVDTHVRKIGVRLFRPDLAEKTLTPRVYQTLGDLFRARFGRYAGWAQQYLFFEAMRKRHVSPSC